jgi:predicted peptidase
VSLRCIQWIEAILIVTAMIVAAAPSRAQHTVDGFEDRSFRGASGTEMPYRLFIPSAPARGRPLPVVVYLHGSGGAGTDNLKQISGGNTKGSHLWTLPHVQARYPAFVVAPQIPSGATWHSAGDDVSPHAELVLHLLRSLSQEFAIDANRIYLTGQSLGGFGTWDLIAKRPGIFAAAIPLCGGGDPARVTAARGTPVWAFHGAMDQTVPVARSRESVAALRAVGDAVKYTEYPNAGHDVWTIAFSEPGLPDWLFAQKWPQTVR